MAGKKSLLLMSCVLAVLTAASGCLYSACIWSPEQNKYVEVPTSCDPPYITDDSAEGRDALGGSGCCLDQNANKACDKYETTTMPRATTTTATKSTTTTTTTSTTTSITTTTQARIECSASKDCGTETSYNKCSNGKVVKYTETPLCSNPGTQNSKCIKKAKTETAQECKEDEICADARCVKSYSKTCDDACKTISPDYKSLCIVNYYGPCRQLSGSFGYHNSEGDEYCQTSNSHSESNCCCTPSNWNCSDACTKGGFEFSKCFSGNACPENYYLATAGNNECSKAGSSMCCCTRLPEKPPEQHGPYPTLP